MSESDPITRLNSALEGRYRIEHQLGEGRMATVYMADDLRHERTISADTGVAETEAEPERHILVTNWFTELRERMGEN